MYNLAAIKSGGEVTLLVERKSNPGFRGFLIQALDKDGNQVGDFKFSRAQRAKCLECRSGNTCGSITHKNASLKRQVVANWLSPKDFVETVQFKYTIVTSYDEYWVGVNGPIVSVRK